MTDWYAEATEVLRTKQHKGNLDLQTANAMVQVDAALSEENRRKFRAMPAPRAAALAWRLVG